MPSLAKIRHDSDLMLQLVKARFETKFDVISVTN